jgi:oxygen-independent coproporphyrinogen-3 oxidase
VQRLISGIRARIPCAPGMEISLEANPGSCDRQKFAGFRDAGVNRISIGIQSFYTRQLERLGRIHDREQALAAAEAAHTAGFDNVNLDLMFGLPEQTVQQAVCDMETAINTQPTHISCYQLTLEPNTWFYRRPPTLPADDEIWEMQHAVQSQLTSAGYCRYEVSAYAKDGRQCRHNLNYWQFGDYLGIGAGAHSKISFADRVLRSMKTRHPNNYLNHASTNTRAAKSYALTAQDLCFEFLMNALRLTHGFSPFLFRQRTGQSLARISPAFTELQRDGLLHVDRNQVKATERGYRYLDEMLQRLLPEGASCQAQT